MASRPTCGLQELQSTRSLRAGGPLKLVAQTPLSSLNAWSDLHVCGPQGFQLHADGEGHEQGKICQNASVRTKPTKQTKPKPGRGVLQRRHLVSNLEGDGVFVQVQPLSEKGSGYRCSGPVFGLVKISALQVSCLETLSCTALKILASAILWCRLALLCLPSHTTKSGCWERVGKGLATTATRPLPTKSRLAHLCGLPCFPSNRPLPLRKLV